MTNFEKLTQDITALAKLILDVTDYCHNVGLHRQPPGGELFCPHCPFYEVNCLSADGIKKWLNEEAE